MEELECKDLIFEFKILIYIGLYKNIVNLLVVCIKGKNSCVKRMYFNNDVIYVLFW